MVALLGSRDELLRVIETKLDSDIHVRGNEITVTGAPADNAIAVRLFEELLELIRAGQNLTPDAVGRALGMLTADSAERPARGAQPQHPVPPGQEHPPENTQPEALRRRDRPAHRGVRDRPGRHREDLSRGREGRPGVAGQAGDPHHLDPPGR